MAKKQALGRGLGALLPEIDIQEELSAQEKVREIPLSEIHPNPDQPRKDFKEEALGELAESIRNFGVMQPLLVVEEAEGGSYMIVAGERRFRAASLAGLKQIPCIIRQFSPSQLAEISLIENIQREDLSALEEADAYRRLMEEYGYTQEKLGQRLGKSRPHVANTLRLLQLYPQEKKLLAEGRISAGHARCLLSMEDTQLRGRLLEMILKEELSVRQTEAAVKKLQGEPVKKTVEKTKRQSMAVLSELEKQLTGAIGMKAHIQGSPSRGKLVVEYRSEDDLQALLDRML
ncbi:MAG: ParB/RepB/Spo0J family partition protein [Bacillota bacterium]|nr:ParB/RepB/Spo0J family partition protein [Bacillota bacterium]